MPNATYGSSFCGYAEFPCSVPRAVSLKTTTEPQPPTTPGESSPPDSQPPPVMVTA